MNKDIEIVKKIKESLKIATGVDAELEHPANLEFGDYATSVALTIAKKDGKNPREVAQEIVQKIKLPDEVEKVDIAGAGFLNFYLNKTYLTKLAEDINYTESFHEKLNEYGKGKVVVIDYSAPNIAKPFGVGHLRSTNIGQAVYNLYKLLGWSAIGDNHLGDWGTQFGKLIVAIKKWGDRPVEEMDISYLEKLYVKFHQESEKDEKLVEEGRDWFAKLENGDVEAKTIWKKCIDISLQEFDRVYQLLGVSIDLALGESFYEPMLKETINELVNKGITKESQGALIIEFENMPPAMIRKTNGTTTYFVRDIATIKYRMEKWNPDLIVYEVGSDHILHFKQLFEVAKMLGYQPKEGFYHLAHGMIRWKEGKFSTREGKTIHLEEVIDKAIEAAKNIADNSQVSKEMSTGEKEEMINKVAIGAIKFTDLSSDPKKDIIFDWDQIMSLEGDSGPYLQYTLARTFSVLEKTEIKEQKNIDNIPTELTSSEEKLLRKLYRFEEKIIDSAIKFNPAILAEFLLEIARTYNEFYAKDKIIGDKNELFRIFLTKTTSSLLSRGLYLLGIETVEKM